jgi:hypothetical protein
MDMTVCVDVVMGMKVVMGVKVVVCIEVVSAMARHRPLRDGCPVLGVQVVGPVLQLHQPAVAAHAADP